MTTKREVIETALQEVWDDRGQLTPADVLEVASQPVHPLHDFFEWSDSEAARLYRLAQAAGLIRSVKIKFSVERNGEVEDIQVRRWIAPRAHGAAPDAPAGYLPEDVVRQDAEMRQAVLRQMSRDVNALRRRFAHLREFWVLMDGLMAERVEATG